MRDLRGKTTLSDIHIVKCRERGKIYIFLKRPAHEPRRQAHLSPLLNWPNLLNSKPPLTGRSKTDPQAEMTLLGPSKMGYGFWLQIKKSFEAQ